MNAIPFDTHEVVKVLRAAGFTDEQAEAVTRVVRDAQSIDLSNVATKADLTIFATKADLAVFATKADLTTFATKADLTTFATKVDLAETKADMLKWMVGAIGVQTVVIIGAVIGLARLTGHPG
jgi:hypothetical protein